jgi:hypothetical protein
MHAGRVLHHRGRIFYQSETGHLHQRRLLLAEREWKAEEKKKERDLQQERGRRVFNEKEAKEEMRSSTSGVGSLIESFCAPTEMSKLWTGARRGSAITGATASTFLGVTVLTLSGSTAFDRAIRNLW